MMVLALKKGYVSDRHTILLLLIGCLFAAAALEPVAQLLGGRVRAEWLLVAIALAALPITLKPLHANREGFKAAGQWLAENVKDGDCVVDPFEWSQFYAGRTLYYVPPDPPADPPPVVTYAVVDDRTRLDDHVRLPRLDAGINVMNDGRSVVAYHWPENVPVEQAKVKVYKLVRPR